MKSHSLYYFKTGVQDPRPLNLILLRKVQLVHNAKNRHFNPLPKRGSRNGERVFGDLNIFWTTLFSRLGDALFLEEVPFFMWSQPYSLYEM